MRVAHMVCPFCARMLGHQHRDGCPTAHPSLPVTYLDGWQAAQRDLCGPLAERILELEDALRPFAGMDVNPRDGQVGDAIAKARELLPRG